MRLLLTSYKLNARKTANIEEAKQMEKMIGELGATIYTDEKIDGKFYYVKEGGIKPISIATLKTLGYLKINANVLTIGGIDCSGYLLIDDSSTEPKFEGHICCPGLYRTDGNINDPCVATFNRADQTYYSNY